MDLLQDIKRRFIAEIESQHYEIKDLSDGVALGAEKVMVSDLAEAGKMRYGVIVMDSIESSQIFESCQIILITGSTLVNGTIDSLMENALRYKRRAVFYGTTITISGAAYLLGLERLCFYST